MFSIRDWRRSEAFAATAQSFAIMDLSGLSIQRGKHASIKAGVEMAVNENGRLHVITGARLNPGDGVVGSIGGSRGDVVGGIQTGRARTPGRPSTAAGAVRE